MTLQEAVQQTQQAISRSHHNLTGLFRALTDPNNGRVIHLPGGQPSRFEGPSQGDVLAGVVDALRTAIAALHLTLQLQADTLGRILALTPSPASGTPRTDGQAGSESIAESSAQGGSQSPDVAGPRTRPETANAPSLP